MSPENTAADLVVKQAAELGGELAKIIADLVKSGSKNLAAILLAALTPPKGQEPTEEQIKGRQRIEKLLSGHTPALLEVPFKDLKQFESEAKRFRLPYAIIENKETEGADIVIRSKDAELFNRVMERMGYGRVDIPQEPQQQENPIPEADRASANESRQEHERETAESSSSRTTTSTEPVVVGAIEYLGEDGEVLMPIEFHDLGRLIESAKSEHDAGTPMRVEIKERTPEGVDAVYKLSDAGINARIAEPEPDPVIIPGTQPERSEAAALADILDEVRGLTDNVKAEFIEEAPSGGIAARIESARQRTGNHEVAAPGKSNETRDK